jgi:hypothetical protein
MPRKVVLLLAGVVLAAAPAMGQATALPSFLAPYRAFERSEFGAILSFASGISYALEAEYRMAAGSFDIGFRGGYIDPESSGASGFFAFGAEARQRVIAHNDDFPLDGAFILGAGAVLPDGSEFLNIPVGLSLGRRIDPEGTQISIVPYVQPTLFVLVGSVPDHVQFSLGLGVDFRLTPRFDARLSGGIGDLEGISLGASWVH